MATENHDSHCRLFKGGHEWFIRRVSPDHFVFLRRPNPPNHLPAYDTVDATRIDWERYCATAHDSMSS